MSRIDDDRQAQRVAERLALEKRQQEERTQKKQQGESAFAKLMQQGTQDKRQVQQQASAQQAQAHGAHKDDEVTQSEGHALDEAALHDSHDQRSAQDRARAKKAGGAFTDKLKQARAGEGDRASEGRFADAGRDVAANEGRVQDQRSGDVRSEARRDDARMGRDALNERGESALKGGQAGRAFGGKGDTKADQDGGGGKGSGGQSKDQGQQNLAGGFRFNPALMAPVPVAQPKENRGSEKLRALANEIAQKIVERVRVGTNAAGAAEFQIDLRSNVLKGLSIKVSGGNGKIRAVFSGGDKDVLKLLQENAEGLKQALGGRGLSLEEFRIEERA